MSEIDVECIYIKKCANSRNIEKCKKCFNNTKRNYKEDYFTEANDNPIPDICPPIKYSRSENQICGYKCPVCNSITNSYYMIKNLCACCGYRLNIKK